MSDRVDTPVESVQTARSEAACDRLPTQSQLKELPARDDAVLVARQFRDQPIRVVRVHLYVLGMSKCTLTSHVARMVR